jgi:hypothetical protein
MQARYVIGRDGVIAYAAICPLSVRVSDAGPAQAVDPG